ncbi:MAG: tail protein X [Veillonellaceae bacterium]|nr:tail protein X [Veillonellaceae bacterium]
MAKYITKMGDTWDLIAFEQLGACDYVNVLIDANREYSNTAIFSAGIILTVPEITADTKVKNLPPWRRNHESA